MDRKTAINLWRSVTNDAPTGLVTGRTLEVFANAVQTAERERCAKQLDALGCDHCASALRNYRQILGSSGGGVRDGVNLNA